MHIASTQIDEKMSNVKFITELMPHFGNPLNMDKESCLWKGHFLFMVQWNRTMEVVP